MSARLLVLMWFCSDNEFKEYTLTCCVKALLWCPDLLYSFTLVKTGGCNSVTPNFTHQSVFKIALWKWVQTSPHTQILNVKYSKYLTLHVEFITSEELEGLGRSEVGKKLKLTMITDHQKIIIMKNMKYLLWLFSSLVHITCLNQCSLNRIQWKRSIMELHLG